MMTQLHNQECTCEKCYEKLALLVWTNRFFRSLTVEGVRRRVMLLESLGTALEEWEAWAEVRPLPPPPSRLLPPSGAQTRALQ